MKCLRMLLNVWYLDHITKETVRKHFQDDIGSYDDFTMAKKN